MFLIFNKPCAAKSIASSHDASRKWVKGLEGFIDKDSSLHNTYVGGLKVLAPNKLEKMVTRGKVDEVLIAMPSVSRSSLKSLLREIEKYSIKVRILPGVAELAQGKVSVSELKEVDIGDY